jgi:hypothetical protein
MCPACFAAAAWVAAGTASAGGLVPFAVKTFRRCTTSKAVKCSAK